jgi:hypothetical protein
MMWTKCMALAIAAGAALFLSAAGPVSATAPGLTAATMTGIAGAQAGSTVIEAGSYDRRGGYGRRGHHGHHRHAYRRHRGGYGLGLALPLLAVPLIIESERQQYDHGDFGDDEGFACYRRCREYEGPDYCRYNYREYC